MTVAFTAVLTAGLLGAVLPGYLTDPSAGGLNEPVEGIYRPPENLQFKAGDVGAYTLKNFRVEGCTVTGANNKPKGARLLETKAFPKTWKLDVK